VYIGAARTDVFKLSRGAAAGGDDDDDDDDEVAVVSGARAELGFYPTNVVVKYCGTQQCGASGARSTE